MTNKNKPTTKVTTPEKVTKAKKPESKAVTPATKTTAKPVAAKSSGKKPVTKIFDNKVTVKKPKVTATTKGLLESMQSELTKTFG